MNAAEQIGGLIHLTTAIGDAREVEGSLLQTKSCRLVRLPIPEQFHDEQAGGRIHGVGCAPENGNDLRFREAIEELSHPDNVATTGQRPGRVEQIGGEQSDSLVELLLADSL